jgi:hypothetical protein
MAIRVPRSFCRGDASIQKNLDLPPRPAQDFFSALSIAGLRKRR